MDGWTEYFCIVISLTKNMGICSYISTSPMPLTACTPTRILLFRVLDQGQLCATQDRYSVKNNVHVWLMTCDLKLPAASSPDALLVHSE